MKKLFSFTLLAAVAAAAMVSCQKEMNEPLKENTPEEEKTAVEEGIKVTLFTDAVDTKTFIEGTTPKWKSTDAVGVFNGTTTTNARFDNTKADGAAAVFDGSVPAVGTYYAYYPHSVLGVSVSKNGAQYKFPETQYPTPTSFDGAADLLLSESFEVASTNPESIDVRFRRLGGFLKFTFLDGTTGSILAGEHALQVKVIVDNIYDDGSKRPCPTVYVTPSGIGTIGAGMKTITAVYEADAYELTADGKATWFGVCPQTFAQNSTFAITISTDNYRVTRTLTLPKDVTLEAGDILPINVTLRDADVAEKAVTKVKVWTKMSSSSNVAWNEYYGGTGGTDRNIAMDDEYVYIAESAATPKLWAISINDPSTYKAVNIEGVTGGGAHPLTCPRILPNTDPTINGGKDILICCSLTRSGVDPKLYMWVNGIDNAPKVVTLVTYAQSAWYGDTFTVYGTLQDGILFFDKTGGDNANGVVTFILNGLPGDNLYLLSRLDFNTAFGSHNGTCAYYPFPNDVNNGV